MKNGKFLTWPGLNNQQLLKHLPHSIETSLQTSGPRKKNLQSTKSVKSEMEVEEDINFYPEAERVTTHEICAIIIPFNIKINGFSDLTGVFLHKLIRGSFYVMFMYDYDSNAILS